MIKHVHQWKMLVTVLGLMIVIVVFLSDAFSAEKGDKKAWKKFRDDGQQALRERRWEDVDRLFTLALMEAEKFDTKDFRRLDSLTDLSSFLLHRGYPVRAEPLLRQLLELKQNTRGELPGNIAEIEYYLAEDCRRQKKIEEAELRFQSAMKMLENHSASFHPLVGSCLLGIARIRIYQKRYPEAEILLLKAKQVFEHEYGEIQVKSGRRYFVTYQKANVEANVLLILGSLQRMENRTADADISYKQMVQILQKQFPGEKLMLSEYFQFVGDASFEQADYLSAEISYQQAFQYQEQSVGVNNPALTNILEKLATVYTLDDKSLDLELTCKRLIQLKEAACGQDSFEITSALSKLADLYFRQEKFAMAEPMYRRSLAIEEKARGEKSLALVGLVSNLAVIYQKQNDDPQLETMLKKQMAIYESVLGDKNPVLIKLLTDYAALLHRNKRDAEAVTAEARAKEIQAAQGQ